MKKNNVQAKAVLGVLCFCMAFLCFSAAGVCCPAAANADAYYTGTASYSLNVSSDFNTKVNILKKAFPSGWYWNQHTKEELNGKQQIKVSVNGKIYYISEVPCTGPTAEQEKNKIKHSSSSDRTICQSNTYQGSWHGTQCHGFGRMLYNFLWGKEAASNQIMYRNDHSPLYDLRPGDLMYSGSHAYLVLNTPNQDGGKIVYADCNGTLNSTGYCLINWSRSTTISAVQNVMEKNPKYAYVAPWHPVASMEACTPTAEYKTVYSGNVNMRSGADPSFALVKALPKDTHFWVDEGKTVKGKNYTWAYSKLSDGTVGWMAISDSSLCVRVGDAQEEPVQEEPFKATAEYKIIYSNGVRVRAGAGTSKTILTVLAKGTHFWIDANQEQISDGYTWARCRLEDGTLGWIAIDPTLMEIVCNYYDPIHLRATASEMQADGTFTVTLNIVNNPGFSQMRVSYSTLGGQASIQAQSCACVGVASGATVQVGDEITINSASPVTGSGQLLTIPMKAQNPKNELTISFSCESAVFSAPRNFVIDDCTVAVPPCSLDLNAAQLTAKASAMQADGTFTVTLGIKNNPGFVAMIISSDYMERGLSLTKCELAGIAAGSSMQEGPTTSIYNLLKVSGEGDILKYSFKSEDKKQVTLRFSCDECALLDESLVNVAAVSVTVQEPSARIPGDVTGDGKVNLSDVVRLLKYVSKWDVTINEANSDVTGDGKINLSDVVRLLKYVSKWDVALQ